MSQLRALSLSTQSPASSLAGPPPAASPRLGRWICQQGLRSARIRGLLLVLAADSAAAAATAASTATALAFFRLVTFQNSYWVSNVYVYVVHGFLCRGLSHSLLHLAIQQEFVAWLVLVDLKELQYIQYTWWYLNNTHYGFIRHGYSRSNSNHLCLVREVAVCSWCFWRL